MYGADFFELIAKRANHISSAVIETGKPVIFQNKSHHPNTGDNHRRDAASLDWDANGAIVWFSPGQALHHIFHALLHLHRYWVQGVPQFWDQKNGCSGMLYEIESCYEHLVIVPVEIAHFPEAYSYWVNHAEEQLYRYQDEGRSRGNIKAKLFQLFLLAQTAFPRSQVAQSIADVAKERGLVSEFAELAAIIFKNFDHKAFVLESLCLYRSGSVPSSLGMNWAEKTNESEALQTYWASLKDYQTLHELPDVAIRSMS